MLFDMISESWVTTIPDSKNPRIDIDQTSIRRESVGSMSYRLRCEGFCYFGLYQQPMVISWKHFSHYWPFVRESMSPLESPHKIPVVQNFFVFFDVCLSKLSKKLSSCRWFAWRFCDVTVMTNVAVSFLCIISTQTHIRHLLTKNLIWYMMNVFVFVHLFIKYGYT